MANLLGYLQDKDKNKLFLNHIKRYAVESSTYSSPDFSKFKFNIQEDGYAIVVVTMLASKTNTEAFDLHIQKNDNNICSGYWADIKGLDHTISMNTITTVKKGDVITLVNEDDAAFRGTGDYCKMEALVIYPMLKQLSLFNMANQYGYLQDNNKILTNIYSNVYSTTPIPIGVWIDGKTIYRVVFYKNGDMTSNFRTGITGVTKIIQAYGTASLNPANNIYIPLNFYNGTNTWNSFHVAIVNSNKEIEIRSQRGTEDWEIYDTYYIIEYIK